MLIILSLYVSTYLGVVIHGTGLLQLIKSIYKSKDEVLYWFDYCFMHLADFIYFFIQKSDKLGLQLIFT